MESLTTVFAMIMGILLRVLIPIAATILVITILKRLDERWKKDADLDETAVVKVGNVGCWDIMNCSAKNRAQCLAYENPDKPCWQVLREKDGRLQERCIGCDVFRHAPVPVAI